MTDAPNPFAQAEYLRAVSRCVPAALDALVAFDPTDDQRLQVWAVRYGFTDAWALDVAQRSSAFWRECPNARSIWASVSLLGWEPAYGAALTRPDIDVRPWMQPALSWNPMSETEASFRARVEAYVSALKTAPGVKRTPEKAADNRHFEWLALHHVGEWTLARIAAKYGGRNGMEVPIISEAIGYLARMVGLTLRARPGRKLGLRRRT